MEINESKLIEHELVIRRLRLPKEVLETRRAIVRWLALSLGIINPGAATKKLKIYTKATNVPSTYKVSVTTYLYGEDGAIAERGECTAEISAIDPKVQDKRGNR